MRLVLACVVTVALAARGDAAPARVAPATAAPASSVARPAARDVAMDAAETEARQLLDGGRVEAAATVAAAWLARDPASSHAHAFLAITRVASAARHIAADLAQKGARERYGDDKYVRALLGVLDGELARAEADLGAAAADRSFALALCPGCWRVDWDGDNITDERILAVEHDAAGKLIPPGDARRHPTFAFDVGDLYYGRAMLDFARALVNVALAYRLADVIAQVGRFQLDQVTLKLEEPARLDKARTLILAGLDHVDRARVEYLAERDDDREWIPSPRQHDHPVPLPVDAETYQRWTEATRALRSLMRGDTALDLGALARLATPPPKSPPRGFLDVSALFTRPRDFVFRPAELKHDRDRPEAMLTRLFGDAYVPRARPNALTSLIARAVDDVRRGRDTAERKLRYIMWLN